MTNYIAQPKFGAKRMVPEFYFAIDSVVNTLRPYATLRTIADALNKAELPTPSGLLWNKDRLAAYLRPSAVSKIN